MVKHPVAAGFVFGIATDAVAVARINIRFIENFYQRDIAGGHFFNNFGFLQTDFVSFAHQNRHIGPIKHTAGFGQALFRQFGFIAEARGIQPDNRPKRQEFLRLFDHIGGRAGNVGSYGNVLPGYQIQKA